MGIISWPATPPINLKYKYKYMWAESINIIRGKWDHPFTELNLHHGKYNSSLIIDTLFSFSLDWLVSIFCWLLYKVSRIIVNDSESEKFYV